MALSTLEAKELADRYSMAVLGVGDAKRLSADAEKLTVAFADAGLVRIIRNPCVTRGEKDSIAREIARKLDVGPVLTRAMQVMAESGRFAIMPDFLSSLSRRIAASDGALVGDVVSASPLKPAQVKELARALETRLHARVRLNSKVDTTLLAGLKITVAGRQYDGTLKGQVEQLRLRLRDIRKGA